VRHSSGAATGAARPVSPNPYVNGSDSAFWVLATGQTGRVRRRGGRLLAAAAAVALVAAIGSAVVLATGGSRAATAVRTTCATRLLRDWADGRIDGTYPVSCYRAALKSLPTDLRVYSSAPDDLRQALSARILQGDQKISGHQGARSVRRLASARATAPSRSSSTRPARRSSRNVNPPR
jgi:hypothetical protein